MIISKLIYHLPSAIWIFISTYFNSLSEFMRVWIALRLNQKGISIDDTIFWRQLISQFLLSRGLMLENMQRCIHLTHYYSPVKSNNDIDGLPAQPNQFFLFLRVLFQKSKCSRSGCFQYYYEWQNHPKACSFHSGRLVNGKYLSCCRARSFSGKGNFTSSGCQNGYHEGNFFLLARLPPIVSINSNSPSQLLPKNAVLKNSESESDESKHRNNQQSSLFLPPIK